MACYQENLNLMHLEGQNIPSEDKEKKEESENLDVPTWIEKQISAYLERSTPRSELHSVSGSLSVRDVKSEEEREKYDFDPELKDNYNKILQENENLKNELQLEKRNWLIIEHRYNYLEKHYEDYYKMKSDYLEMKENKIKEKKSLEISNKATQTWEGILCQYCRSTAEIVESSSYQDFIGTQNNENFFIKRSELFKLDEKFNHLKNVIVERERDYHNRVEKTEIVKLTSLSYKYQTQVKELLRKNKQGQYWLNILQRIIAKLGTPDNCKKVDITLNEQKWIDKIIAKFLEQDDDRAGVNNKASNSEVNLNTNPFVDDLTIVNGIDVDYYLSNKSKGRKSKDRKGKNKDNDKNE